MSLSDRDRKLVLVIVPVLLVAAYWFLLLAPKRQEASQAATKLTKQEERRDAARALAKSAQGAETNFANDYAEIVRLGKAIPSSVDMPSLIVQLDRAASGTGIRFTRISSGERQAVAAAPAAPAAPAPGGGAPVEAGGEQAQSAPGGAAEAANQTAENASNAAASGVDPSDTQTSESSGSGLPVGGGTAAGGTAAPAATSPAGLETVPLELQFVGNFFSLADFFHDIKRFVRVANENVVVSGRLITIDGVSFSSDTELFPRLTAEVTATVYLSPKAEGATAGATPQGPAPTTTPAAQPTPASGSTPATPTPAPTATATP